MKMKKVLILSLSLFTFLVNAQESHNKKTSDLHPIEHPTWHTDMSKATEIAFKENKPLMLFFTGSDWCGWCIRLEREVLNKTDFINWAKENVVLVKLDFPRRTAQDQQIRMQNQRLQQMLKVAGYPTIWFVSPEKKEEKINLNAIGKTGYVHGGTKAWLNKANLILSKTKE